MAPSPQENLFDILLFEHRTGCDWIHHFEQINANHRRVFQCIESLLKLCDSGEYEPDRNSLESLYITTAFDKAEALLERKQRFFGEPAPDWDLTGCAMHHRLPDAYDNVHRENKISLDAF